MRDGNYDYLSKSSVNSPIAFKKSPIKYTEAGVKSGDLSYGQSSLNPGRK